MGSLDFPLVKECCPQESTAPPCDGKEPKTHCHPLTPLSQVNFVGVPHHPTWWWRYWDGRIKHLGMALRPASRPASSWNSPGNTGAREGAHNLEDNWPLWQQHPPPFSHHRGTLHAAGASCSLPAPFPQPATLLGPGISSGKWETGINILLR